MTNTLSRKERILMFLNEYYFGYSLVVTVVRIVGGPLLTLTGLLLYQHPDDRFAMAYSGFCIAFGIYYTLKPLLWILFRFDAFRTIQVQVRMSSGRMTVKDDVAESDIDLQGLRRIHRRKHYYALEVVKGTKIYLPVNMLTAEQQQVLNGYVA